VRTKKQRANADSRQKSVPKNFNSRQVSVLFFLKCCNDKKLRIDFACNMDEIKGHGGRAEG
jgi:hypothetical protein